MTTAAGAQPFTASAFLFGEDQDTEQALIWNGLSRRRVCLVDGMVWGSRQLALERVIGAG